MSKGPRKKYPRAQRKEKIWCVALTKTGWYDVSKSSLAKSDIMLKEVLEDGLNFKEAYRRVLNLRSMVLIHNS